MSTASVDTEGSGSSRGLFYKRSPVSKVKKVLGYKKKSSGALDAQPSSGLLKVESTDSPGVGNTPKADPIVPDTDGSIVYNVEVPPEAKPGMSIRVKLPGQKVVRITVPHDCEPGMTLEFALPQDNAAALAPAPAPAKESKSEAAPSAASAERDDSSKSKPVQRSLSFAAGGSDAADAAVDDAIAGAVTQTMAHEMVDDVIASVAMAHAAGATGADEATDEAPTSSEPASKSWLGSLVSSIAGLWEFDNEEDYEHEKPFRFL